MSHATLTSQSLEPSVPRRLLRQLENCERFPAVLSEPIADDTCSWLAAQTDERKLFWRDRQDEDARAAIGAAKLFRTTAGESLGSFLARLRPTLETLPAGQRFFGGFAFRPRGEALPAPWDSFGRGEFWLPRISLHNERLELLVLDRSDIPAAQAAVQQLRAPSEDSPRPWPSYLGRKDLPDLAGWQAKIAYATELFAEEVLEKIVLARQVTLSFPSPPDAWSLVAQMAPLTPHCYQFGFQTESGAVFFGATPERLFRRAGDEFLSEVVAGTRRRGETPEEDAWLGRSLLESDKDQLEHHIVRKSIRQRLHGCVESLEVDARASLLKLHNKQHLFSRVRGRLRGDVSDAELLERLHPTPAVGGYPTENALSEIERLEPFERGWYAAPVGWISRDESEFVVAIRSALLRHAQLHVYSGAGIVPGSLAEAEWDEIEAKIADFLNLLTPATTASPRQAP